MFAIGAQTREASSFEDSKPVPPFIRSASKTAVSALYGSYALVAFIAL
jgi:hypothetical protein